MSDSPKVPDDTAHTITPAPSAPPLPLPVQTPGGSLLLEAKSPLSPMPVPVPRSRTKNPYRPSKQTALNPLREIGWSYPHTPKTSSAPMATTKSPHPSSSPTSTTRSQPPSPHNPPTSTSANPAPGSNNAPTVCSPAKTLKAYA
ncbi:hypothetical protein K458DRAFT_384404 [Lentithecium fluviatile CBS 122367]|uniref:Uncharacterized protein n=1 Tax=Lentithecium fluviatile CBS 122367 TaxID=1168545 RepID=A0A6G1JH23_9PLEO|nr:hypothetical protein K458DRAFT_384404 [Lentithecium fluviatile CBS 122367]